jgi:methyl-accepting chemotaxis protein
MIAHWPSDLPRYLRRDFPRSAKRAFRGAERQYRGFEVYEVAKRVGDGESGFIHLAIWRQAVITEAQRIVVAIAVAYFILLCCVIAAFVSLSRSLNRPFAELVAHAEHISKGYFAAAPSLQLTDELGDIALALERLRSSLRAATVRLGENILHPGPE